MKRTDITQEQFKSCRIYVDDQVVEVQHSQEPTEEGYIHWVAEAEVDYKRSANIRIEREHYIWKREPPNFTARMTMLTRGVTILLKIATTQDYTLEARIFGFFESRTVGAGENKMDVRFPGWMIPKNGVVITWCPKC